MGLATLAGRSSGLVRSQPVSSAPVTMDFLSQLLPSFYNSPSLTCVRVSERALKVFFFVVVSVIVSVLGSWIYLYLHQCPTDKIISDMDTIVQSLDNIHDSLDAIANTIDGEIKSSEAYKSRQRDDMSEVWNPFTGQGPGRLRRVRRRPASLQEPSFWSWFLIFKRLFHN